MSQLVTYVIHQGIATITMDDGHANVASPDFLDQLKQALAAAEAEQCAVILTGRAEVFCAGFDLNVLRSGVGPAFKMLMGGFWLIHRLMAYPHPVVVACNGHAVALGAFILLAGDYRLGVAGEYKIVANEVKNGLTMPHCALVLCRYRLNPSHVQRAMLLSEVFNAEQAVEAGFLDAVVATDKLLPSAERLAKEYLALNQAAHSDSKLRMRKSLLRRLKRAIKADRRGFVLMGLRRLLVKTKK
ncbi:enoyl-CoA hydratase [Marinicella pacifica]|uniref:Enoyl-CoA hydratase n=1 Tax=Marinicella pacifica TaxID=1171543 RepID=A0A917FQD6_9GAMM|nr:crotonase/enoyl-CoA hydratase family protein [Marinicella pacifica]GGF99501.1 enoyl-CoA hydratase [Marinicella pacifica]